MIVEATAAMTLHATAGGEPDAALQRRLQQTMISAIERCAAEGITNPEAIRKAQLEARDAVLSGR